MHSDSGRFFPVQKVQLMSKSLAKKVEVDDSKNDLAAKKASQLPMPRGYKILIALPERVEKTEGGIIKSARSLQEEEVGSIVGMVLELGADAYTDPLRFPSGAWCSQGDWIVMRSYSGTRIKVHGKEFRLINDDSVEAVVEDPRGISKA